MSTPFYVSPEQLMQDRADFAQKGIARGRSVVALQYADGILLVAENPSQALHKISEIYDRIAFAAVGRYNEFENLRIAGVRLADMRGYAYDRRDVTGRGLANAYAQTLGTIFSSGGEKPYEVEIFVAEVGKSVEEDQIYRLTYQGQVADQHGYAVMGGQAEAVSAYLQEHYTEGGALDQAVQTAVAALGHVKDEHGTMTDRVLPVADLEVAVLDRTRTRSRKFARIRAEELTAILADRGPEEAPPPSTDDSAADPDSASRTTPGAHARPPVAPPSAPADSSPTTPTDPAHPGEASPPAPQPDPVEPGDPDSESPPGPAPQPGGPGEI